PAYASTDSASTHRARRTHTPKASAIAASSSAVLPIPASPSIVSAQGPSSHAARNLRSRAISLSLPISTATLPSPPASMRHTNPSGAGTTESPGHVHGGGATDDHRSDPVNVMPRSLLLPSRQIQRARTIIAALRLRNMKMADETPAGSTRQRW